MKRRSLLSLLLYGAAGTTLAGRGLAQGPTQGLTHSLARTPAGAEFDPVLLLLELRGGNDGLNTLAPIDDPIYRKARPTLALPRGLPLEQGLALHPALEPLLPLWQQRRLGFALGVGWAVPTRSHFKAMDQWARANPEGEGPGWLAKAFETRGQAGALVALGPSGCSAMEGGSRLSLQMGPAQLHSDAPATIDAARAGSNPMLRRLLELESASQSELAQLRTRLAPLPAGLAIPRGELGPQVAMALRLIGSGVCPPVLQLAQGGYDTHANQGARHSRQLRNLAEALACLDAGLQKLRPRPQVSLLAVSEFGRRLRQNGSGGTDHGSASIALLYGDAPPHPFLGRYPRLDELDERGDLI
ncbi:MAG: DUF1501 domain-containing protein, partial [Cyanobacteriota bacterium]